MNASLRTRSGRGACFAPEIGDAGCGGQLEFLGRADRQGKVQGWRVELGEVEACLESAPGVVEAAARFQEDQILAWVVGDRDLSSSGLWTHLGKRLPRPMQPDEVRHLERLPRLSSQKVDRGTLGGGRLLPRIGGVEVEAPGALAELWGRALGTRPGAHDNFFEAGGTSLQAVHLMQLVERKFGVRLPTTVLLEAPTPALLSERIENPPLPEILTSMRPQGGQPPLFLLPGAWGGALGLRELVDRLPADQPVYCFNFEGATTYDRGSLERLAECYAAEVRERCPQGPVRLMGFSMGGLVAYEMALMLEQVDRLVLLDTRGPLFEPVEGNQVWDKLVLAWHLLLVALSSPPRLTLKRLWQRVTGRTPRMTVSQRYDLGARYCTRFEPPPHPYRGPVTLLKLTHQPHYVGQALLGWEGLFEQLSVRLLRGVHSGLILEVPLVEGLAAALAEAFRSS